MDIILNYDDDFDDNEGRVVEGGEDGEVFEDARVQRLVKEFRTRSFTEHIANDMGLKAGGGLSKRNPASSATPPSRICIIGKPQFPDIPTSGAGTAVDGDKGCGGKERGTTQTSLPQAGTQIPQPSLTIQARPENTTINSDPQLPQTIPATNTVSDKGEMMPYFPAKPSFPNIPTPTTMPNLPSRPTARVGSDLVDLLLPRRQQALNRLQVLREPTRVSTDRYRPAQSLTVPRRYAPRGDGEVTKMGAGESYRPSVRPRSPRSDTARFDRDRDRSPRRERPRSPQASDAYIPGGRDRSPLRRRSRSPGAYRSRDRTPPRDVQNWRDRERARSPVRPRSPQRMRSPVRPRSPLRARSPAKARSPMRPRSPGRPRSPVRRFSPRRGDDRRPRSPPRRSDLDERDIRRRSRSPFDNRGPLRARSPISRRSPPAGPRGGGWRPRSRSPLRRDDRVAVGQTSNTWRRPRSPSPSADRSSGRNSEHSTRRPSPRPSYRPAPPLDDLQSMRSPFPRDRSPRRDSTRSTPRERSPARAPSPMVRSPAVQGRSPVRLAQPFRAPTGPSSNRNFSAPIRSPSASGLSTPLSMPAPSRPESAAPAAPPSGPRNFNPPPARGGFLPRGGRGSFSDRRPEPGWGGMHNNRPPPVQSPTLPTPTPSATPVIPTGPRASSSGSDWKTAPPSRSSSISSAPFHGHNTKTFTPALPRVHPAIANLPPIIPGGKIDTTYSPVPKELEARIRKTDEDLERMREDLHAKEEKLRRGLAQWDRLARESASMGLKAELSERHVRMLAGEGVGGAAF
ncbi:hypothetical protein V502_06535 [Pseudogymnoascus sp. VKM F-4520 (FW-2644)]|nr:hypothetical protein V502_06535 [Pseudogymnoascus sp. VKM F-4520 (FW-2644)]